MKKTILAVTAIIMAINLSACGESSEDTAAKSIQESKRQEALADAEAVKERLEESRAAESKAASITSDAFKAYTRISNSTTASYEIGLNAEMFLKEHNDLFPADKNTAFFQNSDYESYIDYNLTGKQVIKNVDRYGDKLIYLKKLNVMDIMETDNGNGGYYTVMMASDWDDDLTPYIIAYNGTLDDIVKGEDIYVYGLPMGMSTIADFMGGQTGMVAIAGSIVGKYGEQLPKAPAPKFTTNTPIGGTYANINEYGEEGATITIVLNESTDEYFVGFRDAGSDKKGDHYDVVGRLDAETDGSDGVWLYYSDTDIKTGKENGIYNPSKRLVINGGTATITSMNYDESIKYIHTTDDTVDDNIAGEWVLNSDGKDFSITIGFDPLICAYYASFYGWVYIGDGTEVNGAATGDMYKQGNGVWRVSDNNNPVTDSSPAMELRLNGDVLTVTSVNGYTYANSYKHAREDMGLELNEYDMNFPGFDGTYTK